MHFRTECRTRTFVEPPPGLLCIQIERAHGLGNYRLIISHPSPLNEPVRIYIRRRIFATWGRIIPAWQMDAVISTRGAAAAGQRRSHRGGSHRRGAAWRQRADLFFWWVVIKKAGKQKLGYSSRVASYSNPPRHQD
jgi:hypothetical protein